MAARIKNPPKGLPGSEGDRLLRPAEVAAKLRVITEKTLRNWRVLGTGPEYLKIGGRVYYSENTLNEWIARRKYGSVREYAPIRD